MQIKPIKLGSSGPLVRRWQNFLRGQDIYLGAADGKFGPTTEASTKIYQFQKKLVPIDGIVGNATWGLAMSEGLELVEGASNDKSSPNWPPRPTNLKPIECAQREQLFGVLRYRPDPTPDNPEGIIIKGSWQKDNLSPVRIPQLQGVRGAPKDGRIFWHKVAAAQILALFEVWEMLNLMNQVESWAGSWCARFSRGSRTYLSNHSWGNAFDINVPQNMLGRRPALVDQPGSVRELVPAANALGFWWGGHGWPPGYSRLDGMHFEIARLLSTTEIEAVLAKSMESDL